MTTYVFSPAEGETWGLTFESFGSHLRAPPREGPRPRLVAAFLTHLEDLGLD
ncbi:hypothetical protein [Streptomyces sp. 147326]|uniref:hypothetical protein n=1 Tax=Streptomyces sp. 147326 TaxID=3074379 RepID=UPI003857AFD0